MNLIVLARNKRKEKELGNVTTKFLTLLRLGSFRRFHFPKFAPKIKYINKIEAMEASSNKQMMKRHFTAAGVITAPWCMVSEKDKDDARIKEKLNLWKTIIAKHRYSSHGKGIYIIHSMTDYRNFKKNHNVEEYIFERYYTYSREYRVHVYKDKCFYAVRKLLKTGFEKDKGKHLDNCIFVNEENPKFNKPKTWNKIEKECVKALKSLHLDLGCVDVLVNKQGKFIIMEVNSNPGLGEKGLEIYKNFLQNNL